MSQAELLELAAKQLEELKKQSPLIPPEAQAALPGAYIQCDGEGNCRVVVRKDLEDADKESCVKKCKVLGCLVDHEEHHIKQIKAFCPDVCKGKKMGGAIAVPWDTNGPKKDLA